MEQENKIDLKSALLIWWNDSVGKTPYLELSHPAIQYCYQNYSFADTMFQIDHFLFPLKTEEYDINAVTTSRWTVSRKESTKASNS